jgi:hypothetical protein
MIMYATSIRKYSSFYVLYIQADSGGKVNILGVNSMSHCEKKKVHMKIYLILNGYQDNTV